MSDRITPDTDGTCYCCGEPDQPRVCLSMEVGRSPIWLCRRCLRTGVLKTEDEADE